MGNPACKCMNVPVPRPSHPDTHGLLTQTPSMHTVHINTESYTHSTCTNPHAHTLWGDQALKGCLLPPSSLGYFPLTCCAQATNLSRRLPRGWSLLPSPWWEHPDIPPPLCISSDSCVTTRGSQCPPAVAAALAPCRHESSPGAPRLPFC